MSDNWTFYRRQHLICWVRLSNLPTNILTSKVVMPEIRTAIRLVTDSTVCASLRFLGIVGNRCDSCFWSLVYLEKSLHSRNAYVLAVSKTGIRTFWRNACFGGFENCHQNFLERSTCGRNARVLGVLKIDIKNFWRNLHIADMRVSW